MYIINKKMYILFYFFQKSSNDSVLLAEFGTRRKRVKDTCEKYGAYTTRWGLKQYNKEEEKFC